MNLSRFDFERSQYTLFDMLSDVGGLSGMLFSLFAIVMKAWNHNSLENYMVKNLFKEKLE